MNTSLKDKLNIGLVFGFLLVFMIGNLLMPDKEISVSERRKKQQFPKLTSETILDGSFMKKFEDYRMDQFPIRDHFRTLKSIVNFGIMEKKDYNGIYIEKGHLSKFDSTLDEASVDYACKRFEYIHDKYLKDKNARVYVSIIPDKNYFLAKDTEYPSYSYKALEQQVKQNMPYATYISIFSKLELEDYYKTDSHWRQEKIQDVAITLAKGMHTTLKEQYQEKELEAPFYGVYYGQSALPLRPERIHYVENKCLDECKVFDYETNQSISIYNMDKANGLDAYEMFLSGPRSLLTIENEQATTCKELIVFRDSFGSSIAPYFVEGYEKVTLVDIRYISPAMLDRFIEFDHQDVLFLYSSAVLNSSSTIK